MKSFHTTVESYRIAMAGLLMVFAGRILIEIIPTLYVGIAVAAIALGIILSKITTRHFGHTHQHVGDSVIDAIPIAVLIFANIAHPAIDGFSAVETFRIGGVVAGSLYATSIVLHEVLRQSAFITALAPLRIHYRWVVLTAFLGVASGITAAYSGAEFFDQYEIVADIATLFSYSFVIAEFYFVGTEYVSKKSKLLFVLGIVLGTTIVVLT